ncbi:MAG: UbiA family prenyltransferase [Actinobacteria bacterium]|nr:UbiA family prenyltransferase [Actinomycetota bacterium]
MNQFELSIDEKRDRTGSAASTAFAYLEALKLRETALLTIIGVATTAISPGSSPSFTLLAAVLTAVLMASAGVNGLTCYLDRGWDAKMARTRDRPLPSGRIAPAERLLPVVLTLVLLGLGVGYLIHPLVALAGAIGTVTAVVARKTWVTHYLGIVSSLAPIWMGWFAVYQRVNWTIIAISLMVSIWVLIHVWSLMLAYRDDYLQAGVHIFPVTARVEASVRWLVFLSLCLAAASFGIYFTGAFGSLYAVTAALLSLITILASIALAMSRDREGAWRLYKFSAFPFLGLIFLVMVIDRLIK